MDEAKSSAPSSISPIVLVLVVINALGLMAVAFFQYRYVKQQAEKPSIEELIVKELEKQSHGTEVKHEAAVPAASHAIEFGLDPFIVNLAQGDGPRRYLRLNLVLQFSAETKKEELEARKPQLRDAMIGLLNTKRAEDLLVREGKVYLKQEIKSALNAYLSTGQLVDVFYTQFQIN